MNSLEIFDLLEKATSLLSIDDIKHFKSNFSQIKEVITSIPGHEELVIVNELDTLEDWQLTELRTTLLEQLNKTKETLKYLKKTGYKN